MTHSIGGDGDWSYLRVSHTYLSSHRVAGFIAPYNYIYPTRAKRHVADSEGNAPHIPLLYQGETVNSRPDYMYRLNSSHAKEHDGCTLLVFGW